MLVAGRKRATEAESTRAASNEFEKTRRKKTCGREKRCGVYQGMETLLKPKSSSLKRRKGGVNVKAKNKNSQAGLPAT